jgi:uncharacterized protein YdbL (DUF1318 family)
MEGKLMKQRSFWAATAAIVLAATPALAIDLQSARSTGKVCEQADGYVRAVTGDAHALADGVNAKRKAEYARISGQTKQPVDVVGKLAAQQIVKQGAKACP